MRSKTGAVFKGWKVQARVITALMLRDAMMRYGRENIGFVWVILEPMLLCTGVMILWSSNLREKQSTESISSNSFSPAICF